MYNYRLEIYFQVIPCGVNLTLDVKINGQKRGESEQNSHCRFCGLKLGLDYQMLSTPMSRRPFYGALLFFWSLRLSIFCLYSFSLFIFLVHLTPRTQLANHIRLIFNLLNDVNIALAVLCAYRGAVCPAVGLCFPENTVFYQQLVIILPSHTFDPFNIRHGLAMYQ